MKTFIFIHGGESFTSYEEYLTWIQEIYPTWMVDPWEEKESKLEWKMRITKEQTKK